jgi:alpha-L-rhamnosidase
VWAGIVTGDEAAAVLSRALDDPALPEPQPYFQHYVFDALARVGLYESRARRQLDLWRGMLAENPGGLREMWTHGDWSHAWGGTPLVQLSRRVLGLEPIEPGWRRARLKPCPLDLTWARGVVPTPHGDVRVEWELRQGAVETRIRAPDGVEIVSDCSRQPAEWVW